ncbi:MAG: OmpA family protein [Betaproteobacteria bacterium]|nr:OmpA family protein [Betaproteobacteria bacterium]MCC6246989.1 OmpA family protein [Rubrivivax sp.]
MLDELDDGARIGVWTALGVVALLLFGLLGGLAIKQMGDRKPAVAAASTAAAPAATGAAAAGADTLLDAPLAGDLAGTLYFASGVATLGAETADSMKTLAAAVQAAAPRQVVLSGFHDATGDPAKNAELAKERAKAVREALKAAGVAAERIALRKPESTTGDGSNQEARRVEVRLLP